ncbi:MAG: SDR family oxidoreductase [Ectothiorhodospiraceae bacterium]|nr:SDR family oxidoreductase [Ectothiorhodospiraceae bacterium]MCH8506311.1 SDR family oxidoreductase [Ectothiorhodospiraceae bacterium]
MDLDSKVAVITGASRGIGRAIAEALSGQGMRVVLAARSSDLLEQVARTCVSEVATFPVDLREQDAPQRLIDFAVQRFGRVDLLVNNAGATKRGDFFELTEDDWHDGFALKFYGAVRCTRAAWPALMKSGGSIVNIVGIGGRTGSAEFAIGGAVNAAVLNFTKVMADRGVSDGVRVNAINPGPIRTDRLTVRIKRLAEEQGIPEEQAAGVMAEQMRVSRFGEPREVADVVVFLASSGASYCQGAVLDVDGGLTRTL